jgi:transposase
MLHRTRDLLMRQRTQVINALRAHLAELGMTAAQGNAGLRELLAIIAGSADERLPVEAHGRLIVLAAELQTMRTLIASIEKRIIAVEADIEQSASLRPDRFKVLEDWASRCPGAIKPKSGLRGRLPHHPAARHPCL